MPKNFKFLRNLQGATKYLNLDFLSKIPIHSLSKKDHRRGSESRLSDFFLPFLFFKIIYNGNYVGKTIFSQSIIEVISE